MKTRIYAAPAVKGLRWYYFNPYFGPFFIGFQPKVDIVFSPLIFVWYKCLVLILF